MLLTSRFTDQSILNKRGKEIPVAPGSVQHVIDFDHSEHF